MSPLLMDEFGWTNFHTVFYGGIILAGAGVIAILCFYIVKLLSARYALPLLLCYMNPYYMNVNTSFAQ